MPWSRTLAAAVLCGGLAAITASAAADETPEVKDIMKKVNGKKGIVAKINDNAKADKWDEAQKLGKELKELGAAMAKNHPHLGEDASWEKLTKKYGEETAAIAAAAEKKDAKAVETAVTTFTKEATCNACHKEHKPKMKR